VLERICTNLLKLAHKWEIEVAKDHAIGLLQTIDIPPSRRLQLAGKFGITQWVEPTVAKIFEKRESQRSLILMLRPWAGLFS
jgi:hypothetical protein